jgi:zinc/manganese transport system permease protein
VNWDAIDISILGPAMLAGILVLSTHVPMGREVLKRGIIFIDLAVAQLAGLGVILAGTLGWEIHGYAAQAAAFGSAIAGAILLTWVERNLQSVQEAIIGVMFVLAATAGMLLLANNPRGGDELKDLLVGQILWVELSALGPATVLTALVLGIWVFLRGKMHRAGFYVLFALSVTVSVQLVGVYLVFSSLIIPALPTRNMGEKGLWAAYAVGLAGYVLGMLLSALMDLPTGPMIVWAMACVAVVVGFWRGRAALQ